jgi:two-component system OmpR family sensor kinase/two-component system sensor histidine kinase BaeS
MGEHPGPPVTADGGRVPLARSFAFRLGVAFAAVAVAAAAVTALVVNAAFVSRFDHYLAQQQHAQVTRISMAAGRAYAGGGKWDLHALQTLVPAAGPGTVRVVTPAGQDVWQWDGHEMSWNDHWMEGSQASSHGTGQGSGQGGGTSSGCGSWDHCGTWDDGSRHSGSSPDSAPAPAGTPPAAVLAAATATPAPGPPPGAVQDIPIKVNGQVVGTAQVRLPRATALPDAIAFRGQVIALVLAAGAAGALVSLALGIGFARRATRPVWQMTSAARALAAGNRSTRLDTGRRDEFGQMSRAFNALADAAEHQDKLRQGFAAEVAHELRTPLTILRSQVEGLRVGVLEPSAGALASLGEEVQRITRLTADLQILGSADAAGFTLERTTTDLGKLADETAREFAGLFEGAGITLQTQLGPATACADQVRIGQIVANLLSNALKYTPEGGLVRLETTTDGPWAIIRVTDTGPGIPADELPHVFDRFFRGRAARPAGSGIGLTVVAELAAAHGGTAEAASQPGQGATFTIRLPAQVS